MQLSALIRSEDVDSDLTPLVDVPMIQAVQKISVGSQCCSVLLAAKAARPRTPDQRK